MTRIATADNDITRYAVRANSQRLRSVTRSMG